MSNENDLALGKATMQTRNGYKCCDVISKTYEDLKREVGD